MDRERLEPLQELTEEQLDWVTGAIRSGPNNASNSHFINNHGNDTFTKENNHNLLVHNQQFG